MRINRAFAGVFCWAMMAGNGDMRTVRADALPASAIPAGARWVMHMDIDAVRGTPLWEMFHKKFVEPRTEEFAQRQRWIEAATGTNMRKDLHDLTLFGTTFDENGACLLIHAPMDQARVVNLLQANPEFKSATYNGRAILSWRDNGKLLFGCFASTDLVVLGRSNTVVSAVLDTIDGKSPPLKNERLVPQAAASMEGGVKALPLFWMAAMNVSDLPQAQKVDSPFLLQIETASLAIAATHDRLTARLAVLAKSEKSAQQLMAAADGVKAMIGLAAADERANPKVRTLGSTIQDLSFKMDGRDVIANWSVELDKLDAMLDVVRLEARSATAPATNVAR